MVTDNTANLQDWLKQALDEADRAKRVEDVKAAQNIILQIVESGYGLYRKEIDELGRREFGKVEELEFILRRLEVWDGVYWGYDNVQMAIDKNPSALSQRVAQIRNEIRTTHSNYRLKLENALRATPVAPWTPIPSPWPVPPPTAGWPSPTPSWATTIAEQSAKQQQAFRYTR